MNPDKLRILVLTSEVKELKTKLRDAKRVLRTMLRRTSVGLDGRVFDESAHIGRDVFEDAQDVFCTTKRVLR